MIIIIIIVILLIIIMIIIKVGSREYPNTSVEKHEICSDPMSADPICPFPNTAAKHPDRLRLGALHETRRWVET